MGIEGIHPNKPMHEGGNININQIERMGFFTNLING